MSTRKILFKNSSNQRRRETSSSLPAVRKYLPLVHNLAGTPAQTCRCCLSSMVYTGRGSQPPEQVSSRLAELHPTTCPCPYLCAPACQSSPSSHPRSVQFESTVRVRTQAMFVEPMLFKRATACLLGIFPELKLVPNTTRDSSNMTGIVEPCASHCSLNLA